MDSDLNTDRKDIQTLCGFRRHSAIASVCESLAIKKADRYFDGKWDFKPSNQIRKRKPSVKDILASL